MDSDWYVLRALQVEVLNGIYCSDTVNGVIARVVAKKDYIDVGIGEKNKISYSGVLNLNSPSDRVGPFTILKHLRET